MVLQDALPLVPFPASVRRGNGSVPVDSVRISGDPGTAALLTADLKARLDDDAVRAAGTTEIALAIDSAVSTAEGYRLVAQGTTIRITGHDAAGAYYGTRTLLQLLRHDGTGWTIPEVLVEDAPRFRYRGVMLDVARHFFDVTDVERFIDRMTGLKFNHLHLHLTDDQGWRLQIDAWPLLAERGGASEVGGGPGGFFTTQDYREIVSYAAARGMTVVPEIDLPGHTHAIGLGYPDLVEAPAISAATLSGSAALHQALPEHGVAYTGWAVGHSSVRIHEERSYDLIRDVLTEVADLTPGPYLHIGGDECLGTSAADFAVFMTRVSRMAAATGKTPIAWHEAGAVDDLAAGMIGQYWANADDDDAHRTRAARFSERGGALILSPSDRAYLDMKPRPDFPLGLTWAGIVPLRAAYDWEPTAVIEQVPVEAILGVEAPLWTETVSTLADADALAFPRVAALAEIAWSPQCGPERTWESFRCRLVPLVEAWEASGIAVDRGALDDPGVAGTTASTTATPAVTGTTATRNPTVTEEPA